MILIFGASYAFMEIVFNERHFSFGQLPKALLAACFGKSWDHLWYLYMATGIYILAPALKIFAANSDDKTLFYTLFVLFVFSSIVPFASLFLDFKNDLPQISIYIFYMIFGYAVHYKKFELKILPSIIILIVFLLYLSVIQMSEFFLVENNAALKGTGYNSPFVVLAAWAVFSLCKKVKKQSNFVKWLSPLTFGIYVIHPVPINFCYKVLHITVEKYPLIPSLCIVILIVFSVSISATLILRTIPFVRKHIL